MEVFLKNLINQNKSLENFIFKYLEETRSHVRFIYSYSEILKEKNINIDSESLFYFNHIMQGSKRLNTLLDFLTLQIKSLTEKGDEFLDSSNLVIEAIYELDLKNLESSIDVQESMPHIFGNKDLFKWVLKELITNGLKFNNSPQKKIYIGKLSKKGSEVIFIQDNGKGIQKKFYRKIFEPFEKLESENSGLGGGLYLCQQIMEKMEGKIWMKSKFGSGSTFYLSFPKQKGATLKGPLKI